MHSSITYGIKASRSPHFMVTLHPCGAVEIVDRVPTGDMSHLVRGPLIAANDVVTRLLKEHEGARVVAAEQQPKGDHVEYVVHRPVAQPQPVEA
jgi:hypothetical protein